jgi:REP element-mobilizing transposase RayT
MDIRILSLRSRRQNRAWGGAEGRNPRNSAPEIHQPANAGDSHSGRIMAETFTNLIYHIVFSTKNRQPLITGDHQSRLYDYIGGTIRDLGGISLAINGTEDHVHLLAKLRPDKALSDVLRDLKANASGWMHDVFPDLKDFSWQRGYGAFTVSQSNVERVQDYIARQKEHHQKKSFRDEFIEFLEANGIEYNEKYL